MKRGGTIAFLVWLGWSTGAHGAAAEAPPTASTTAGLVEGIRLGRTVLRFAGIPYARAPLGALRFKSALPPDPWQGTRAAHEHGPSCMQPGDPSEPSSLRAQSEDCLWLSLWTQGTDRRHRPVMVFVHGGGFWYGSAADPSYDGTEFAARGNVVLVDIQYRLGAFGWIDLDPIAGADYADAKNLGLLDQVAALEWVKRNVEAFGGDPNNITVFGESAGSVSASVLALMPRTRTLFNKVIAESGVPPRLREDSPYRSARVAQDFSRELFARSGATSVRQLQALSAGQFLAASEQVAAEARRRTPSAEMLMGGPTPDPRLFPRPLAELLAARAAAGTKFLNGTNADEFHYWLFYDEQHLREHPKEAVHAWLAARGLSDAGIDELHTRMARDAPGRSASDLAMDAVTQASFRNPHLVYSDIASREGDVWMYLFDFSSSGRPPGSGRPEWGAFHAIELPFVFHNLGPESSYFAGDDLPVKLADRVQDAWVAFARSGNPDTAQQPHWSKFDTQNRATMILGRQPVMMNDPESAQRLDVEAALQRR